MQKTWMAKWIVNPNFYGLTPINVFHKEHAAPLYKLEDHRDDLKNRHTFFRKVFDVSDDVETAYIDISADDYYKLYINGIFIGQGPAPAYHFHYNYNRYDISEIVRKGKNVIAVHVYYQGLINRVWNSGDYRQGMIAEIFANGNMVEATDSTWKYQDIKAYGSGETTGYSTQFLENFDSELFPYGWEEMDFNDSQWGNVLENINDDHKLFLQETPPLQVYELRPAEIHELDCGHFLVDFGQEITGQIKMSASGKPGEIIEIRCGEELLDNNLAVRHQMRSNCKYQEFWRLSGRMNDELEFFDYKVFRYVEIISPPGTINRNSIRAVVRHYPLDESKAQMVSSDSIFNDIWLICRNGVRNCSQEGYLDCPGREKGQYLGDMMITAQSHLYISGDLRLFKKGIRDFALSSYICPGLMAVAPGSLMQEFADYSFLWPMQLLIYYKHSGDIEFLKEMYPVAEGMEKYFRKYRRGDGLVSSICDKHNLVDWPANLRDGYDFELKNPGVEGTHNVINALYIGFMEAINEIRTILGIPYEDEVPILKRAFVKAFFDKYTGLFADTEKMSHHSLHSNIFPLLFGIAPDDAKARIVEFLKAKRLSCGVYMAYFYLKALAKCGEYDFIYSIITSKDQNSWYNMIREGATCCFEAWGKDLKWNTSLCHAWASAPIPVFIEDIVGLSPAKTGWEEVNFTPHIPSDIKNFELKITVKTGEIRVKYENSKAKMIFLRHNDNLK